MNDYYFRVTQHSSFRPFISELTKEICIKVLGTKLDLYMEIGHNDVRKICVKEIKMHFPHVYFMKFFEFSCLEDLYKAIGFLKSQLNGDQTSDPVETLKWCQFRNQLNEWFQNHVINQIK